MRRGDVVRVRPAARSGREQRGARYGVVVQADVLLPLSTVIVVPTSRSAQPSTFRPTATVMGERTRLLVDQLTAMDRQRVGDKVDELSIEESWALDDALRTTLALTF